MFRTSQRTDQKLQKSFHLFDPKNEFQNIFSNAQKKIKHPNAQTNMTNKMTQDLKNNNGLQTRWTGTPAHNSTYKKLAVQWLNEVPFFNQTFVQVDSLVLRNRQLLIAAKRYLQA